MYRYLIGGMAAVALVFAVLAAFLFHGRDTSCTPGYQRFECVNGERSTTIATP